MTEINELARKKPLIMSGLALFGSVAIQRNGSPNVTTEGEYGSSLEPLWGSFASCSADFIGAL